MFSNLLVLDTYHGPFVGRDEVQTLVDENNHWFWAHRISQIYRLSSTSQDSDKAEYDYRKEYASGTRSPCAFIPLDDSQLEIDHFKNSGSDDADDCMGGIANDVGERSLRWVKTKSGCISSC